MSKTHQVSANVFTGGLNSDVDPHVLDAGDYIDATDVINGYGGQIGAIMFPRGNTKVNYTLPAGINRCIGAPEDKQTQSSFLFIYNSNDNHSIIWWRPLDELAPVRLLARGAVLNFSLTQFISQASIVDGKLLYWTDGQKIQGTLRGNPPREFDAETADLTDKDRMYEIYAGLPGEGQFAAGNEYTFKITDGTGIYAEETFNATGDQENDPEAGLAWLKMKLEESTLALYLELNNCGCKLEITLLHTDLPAGYYLELTTVSAGHTDILLVGVNHYPSPLQSYHLDLIKQPAYCAPTATYVTSTLATANNVEKFCGQFRVRYIYRTGARSAWSPISNVALNTGLTGETVKSLNAIEVDFTDDRLIDPSWLFMIRAVEVAFRDGNTSEFKLIDRFDVCEIGILKQKITFLNDKLYQNVESDDVSIDPSIQVIKPFDNVPLISGTLTVGADANGNNLMFLGNNKEGYDCPDCVDLTVEAVPFTDECLIDVTGTVEIINDSNYPSANPDYSAYPLGGFVVYLAGTPYFAISNNSASSGGDGRFRISGVPRGHYIIRVASYKCSFTSEFGERMNLSNGLEWQRTSAPVLDCAGSVANGLNQYERLIDLTTIVDEFDLDVEAGYGTIQIQNAHFSHRATESEDGDHVCNLQEFYLLDNNALNTDALTRNGALNCERQHIILNGFDNDLYTDHNGYAAVLDTYIKVTVAPPIDTTITVEHIDDSPLLLIVYRGNYSDLENDTLVETDDPGTIKEEWGGGNYFIFNLDTNFTKHKRNLMATTLDGNGDALAGVLVIYSRTTRTATTGQDGTAKILCYARYDDDYRNDDYVIYNYPEDICYEHYPLANPVTVDDFRIVYLIGMDLNPRTIVPVEFGLIGGMINTSRFLKAGGVYDFGIVYEDTANRTCGVAKGFRLHVPFHVGGLTRYQTKWTINSLPPDWAHHYRIVRTKNSLHQTYVQWTATEVIYVRIPSSLSDPIPTTFEANDYTHIMFRLFIPVPGSASESDITLFWQQDGQQGYVPQENDIVRLILDSSGNSLSTSSIIYQAPIVATYVNAEKMYAIVPADFGGLNVKPGTLVEYMTPRLNVEEVYYEGGEDCYDIIEPYFQNRRHSGPLNDQILTAGESTTPARGMLTGGDTYWRRQLYTETAAFVTEHYTPTRLLVTPCEDIGRPFVYDPDAAQIDFYNRMRFSGKYVPNSNVNDLGSFGALDYQDLNRKWGEIKWTGFANNVLLAICQFKVQPLYVRKGQILFLSGETSVGRSDDVMNIADASVSNYGTNNPESVVEENGLVYFWDGYNGTVCRYSQAGVDVITVNMIRYFRDLGRTRSANVPDFVIGGYDRRHQMYVLAGFSTQKSSPFCIGFDEVKGRWVSRYSYNPEMFCRVGQEFVTFKDGFLWRHHINNAYCNWYGTQYKPTIRFAANANQRAVKLFFSMAIETNRGWNAPVITIPRNMNFNNGMLSRLKSGKFRRVEGLLCADFMRDMNDTSGEFLAIPVLADRQLAALLRGRRLRGEYLDITLEADNGAFDTRLVRVDTYYVPSEETNA